MAQPRFKDIQLPQLRSFCLVATEGSFTKAAKLLDISVPAVWDRVRALERRLGVTLLRWHDQTVELTRDGRLLLDLVQPHVSGLDSLVKMLEVRRAELPDQLVIASIQYLVDYHLPVPIRQFNEAHPLVSLRVLADTRWGPVIRAVEEGDAELGLTIYDPDEPRSRYLDYHDLFPMDFMLLAPPGHALLRKKKLEPADLVGQPLILTPGGRAHLEKVLRRDGLADRLHIVLETNSTITVQHYVAQGVGVSAGFAEPQLAKSPPRVQLRVLDPARSLRTALLVCKGAHLSAAATSFREIARRSLSG